GVSAWLSTFFASRFFRSRGSFAFLCTGWNIFTASLTAARRLRANCGGMMKSQRAAQLFLVRQVKAQGSNRDPVVLNRPPVGPLFGSLQRDHGEPEDWASHWFFARRNFAVVLPYRMSGPTNTSRFLRYIHVDQRHGLFLEKHIDHLHYVGIELL